MKLFALLISILLCSVVTGQEYNYIHYETRDGLASATVYRMCQDSKGYIWFATDNGVSRFDGKTFRNFSTKDGLTDNEVLFIECDSRDRVWMMPFNKTLCYFSNNRIHNSTNDSSLRKIHFNSYAIGGWENKKGQVYFYTEDAIYLYDNAGQMKKYLDYNQLAAKYSLRPNEFSPHYAPYQYPYLVLYNRHNVFIETDTGFAFVKQIKSDAQYYNRQFSTDSSFEFHFFKHLPAEPYTFKLRMSKDTQVYCTLNGAWLVDSNGTFTDKATFLAGKKISHAIMDKEGNIWFSTLGEGVYRLNSTAIKTFLPGNEFLSIARQNHRIYAGMANGCLQIIENGAIIKTECFEKDPKKYSLPRLYTMKSDNHGNVYLGFDSYLMKYSDGKKVHSPLRPIKSIDIIDNDHIMVATNYYVLRLRSRDLVIVDTVLPERGTKAIVDHDKYFIGTLDGVVVMDSGRVKGKQLRLARGKRIVDMCTMPDGRIWIACHDKTILLYKDGKVSPVINTDNIKGDVCKSLFTDGHYLWIGTNKGVSKFDIITRKISRYYSIADGLSSDIINSLYSDGNNLWTSTPGGLTYFNEAKIADSSICNLDINVYLAGKLVDPFSDLRLGYTNNNISFNYTAVSFKSAGEITYRYMLKNIDDSWIETNQTTVSYASLSPGKYEFMLQAINKFGKESTPVTIRFSIAAPFWRTTWFWLIAAAIVFALVWYLFHRRYKSLQKKIQERNKILTRVAELEQLSLRSQINPHFIFNCLSSIQGFVLNDDTRTANHYIGEFGSLMRQTLDNSSKLHIPVTREINYLESYMKLEQMRFPSKFRYEIKVDESIQTDEIFVPSMLFQPFVENAIRHGLRHKKDGIGIIKIAVRKTLDRLVFEIEDNGIGRKAAAGYKTLQHIEYQSRGISLTLDRLNMLNPGEAEKTEVQIVDLTDENGNDSGTRVTVSFPQSIIEKLKQDDKDYHR